ncbi:hypothetical protein Pcinc_044402 [Petrolisthes cinctipes]|uniref:Uncharacterized protein n=1 Tax=Petrolisthes cinctipes TaxID=88211 RepID=A0AAE1BGW4_PETCI|nr:hypothetical protein Pcinc_044402 [Petrolisthes cinctipes]
MVVGECGSLGVWQVGWILGSVLLVAIEYRYPEAWQGVKDVGNKKSKGDEGENRKSKGDEGENRKSKGDEGENRKSKGEEGGNRKSKGEEGENRKSKGENRKSKG